MWGEAKPINFYETAEQLARELSFRLPTTRPNFYPLLGRSPPSERGAVSLRDLGTPVQSPTQLRSGC